MKKKIGIGIAIILALTLCCLGGIYLYFDSKSTNDELLKEMKSMISLQKEYEKEFKIKGYTINKPNIILDPYHVSPLSALIMFETKNEVSPTITIKGKDKLSTFTHTFEFSKKHYLEIYGLYPNQNNEVMIEYEENGEKVTKKINIKTAALPQDFILPTKVKSEKDKLTNDLYFYTPSSKGYTCAYDVNGDVRWYLSNNAAWDNTRLQNGHMIISTERLVNPPYYLTGLYEIDLLGKIYNEFSLPGGYHHDYFELPNGNLLVGSNDFNSGKGTVEDVIVELDRNTGEVVKTIDLKNILNMEDGKSENWTSYDWFHNNSIWYDELTNSITLSGRHQDAVINLDYKTGKLNWIIGDNNNWSKEYQKYFFKPVGDNFEWQWSQHAAMITPEGYVFILDNGNNKSKNKKEYVSAENSYTRGVMYKIDTKKMTIEQVWEYGKKRGSEFYSPYISDVDYLNKDHYIVHSGGIVYVDGKNSNQPAGLGGADKLVSDTVEIKNNEVIFELILPTNNYRVEKMSLYSNDKYNKKEAKKLGTLGKTTIDKKEIGFIKNASKIDNKYDVKLTKEEDRLVVTGKFKRENKVNIILYNNMKMLYYNVRVSKHPYTALCIDIFSEEENKKGITVTKYINKENLKGKYSVYIEVDGKVYNTEKVVEF